MSRFDGIVRGGSLVTPAGEIEADVAEGRIVGVLVRGNVLFEGGKMASGPVGRLVRPAD